MKKLLVKFPVLFVIVFYSGCSEDPDPIPPLKYFYGNYNLQAITAGIAMDFNNNGQSTPNLLLEIEEVQGELNNRLSFTNENTEEMNFSIMEANVLTEFEGIPIIRFLPTPIRLFVTFDQLKDEFVSREQIPSVLENAEFQNIVLVDQLTLDITYSQRMYDYAANQWIIIPVTYRFVRGTLT
ncbi:hypothetical protein [Shivajiella indica]|uniref:DUF4843 domain-containing protein n=1 Tax=Shivajiella indica TaxID=872115 RepID=A0ABW5BAV6_9BACT